MDKILEELQKPFPPSEHSHRNIRGRSEDWVEDHYLIQRLNKVCGMNWSWQCQSESVTHGKPNYAWCRWSLNILSSENIWIAREGYGGDDGNDMGNVLKGATSYAKRHACKNWGMALECWITPTEQGQLTSKELEPVYTKMVEDLHQAFVGGVPHATVATNALTLLTQIHDNSFKDITEKEDAESALIQIAEKHNPKDSLRLVKEAFIAESPRWTTGLTEKFQNHMREIGRLLPIGLPK